MKQIVDTHIRFSIEFEKMLNELVELDKKRRSDYRKKSIYKSTNY